MITVLKDVELTEVVGGFTASLKLSSGGGFASRLDNFMDRIGVPQQVQTAVFRFLGLRDPDAYRRF